MLDDVLFLLSLLLLALISGFFGWYIRYTMCCNGTHCIDIKEDCHDPSNF